MKRLSVSSGFPSREPLQALPFMLPLGNQVTASGSQANMMRSVQRERERSLSRLLLFCGAGFLALAASSCGGSGRSSAAGGPRLAAYLGRTLGEANAPIAIEAILPVSSGCQDDLGIYVVGVAARHPAVFRARIYDMKSSEGRALMAAKGIKCAAVLVQGTTRFDLGSEFGKVLLEGPMDAMDLYRVLQFQLGAIGNTDVVLPDPPEDSNSTRAEERRKAGF